jgi:hypothetical protein
MPTRRVLCHCQWVYLLWHAVVLMKSTRHERHVYIVKFSSEIKFIYSLPRTQDICADAISCLRGLDFYTHPTAVELNMEVKGI